MTTQDEQASLVDQLRTCAATKRDAFNPFWDDAARKLMRWAADTIEAANYALGEDYRRSESGKGGKL
jgi:hypothetical protein